MTIARVAQPVAASDPFDYWVPAGLSLARGAVVRVNLARRSLPSVVVDVTETSALNGEKLRPLSEIVADLPALPDDLLELGGFVAGYYQEPLGLALAQMVPPLGRAGSRAPTLRKAAQPLAS